ncbi:MAG: asparagine synthase (glutamine-hydrolyzing), partial [Bacteroidetes bacterium]|nr:asparagine synthase (glutamine-hydrolyzing) [Bacteroidota bacterium]
MIHRGPDDQGKYFKPGVGLAHRRLSIIDLSHNARQPLCNEQGSKWVVFNGEIYNFLELRKELQGKGHFFKTKTDSEVIVHSYEEWGEACIERFRGMFAFALWDESNKRLLLVRDRLGIKPLYYAIIGMTVVFASEIKSLLVHPKISREVNAVALDTYLRLQFIPAPNTVFKDIQKLPAGHFLIYENDSITIQRYWQHRFQPELKSEEEWIDELELKILEAVQLRLMSDVPIGAFLSGGIDSSIVVLAMSRLLDKPVQTFSIDFKDPRFSEQRYARKIAEICGADHHEETVPPGLDQEFVESLVCQLDEPMSDGSFIPTFQVSQLARQKVTVALSGDGGDETFAGYQKYLKWMVWQQRFGKLRIPTFMKNKIQEHVHRLPWGRRTLLAISLSSIKQYAQLFYNYYSFNRNFLSTEFLYGPKLSELLWDQRNHDTDIWERLEQEIVGDDILSRVQHVDFLTYLPEDILMKVDKMSMFNSLEVRVPLLDHEVQELACRMPSSLKLRNKTNKYVLKRLMERWGVPNDLIHREKIGFGPSLNYWFANGWWKEVGRMLLGGFIVQEGWINKVGIEHIIAQQDTVHLWNLWLLDIWARNYLS